MFILDYFKMTLSENGFSGFSNCTSALFRISIQVSLQNATAELGTFLAGFAFDD